MTLGIFLIYVKGLVAIQGIEWFECLYSAFRVFCHTKQDKNQRSIGTYMYQWFLVVQKVVHSCIHYSNTHFSCRLKPFKYSDKESHVAGFSQILSTMFK